jgi:transcription elongation factor GreB
MLGPMSKAFTSEETATDPILVRSRPPLPAGVPNYVTRRGLEKLREEVIRLETERAEAEAADDGGDSGRHARLTAIVARLHELNARIGSAVVLDSAGDPSPEVRFGATVVVRSASGPERRYQIVGVDEADARAGRVAFVSPLARALLGRQVGDIVLVDTPRGEEELEIIAVT